VIRTRTRTKRTRLHHCLRSLSTTSTFHGFSCTTFCSAKKSKVYIKSSTSQRVKMSYSLLYKLLFHKSTINRRSKVWASSHTPKSSFSELSTARELATEPKTPVASPEKVPAWHSPLVTWAHGNKLRYQLSTQFVTCSRRYKTCHVFLPVEISNFVL